MDPNATLAEIRALVGSRHVDGERLAELFTALDGWLSKGGFLPTEWSKR